MVGGFNKKIWLDLMKICLRLGDTVDIANISMGNLSTNKIEEHWEKTRPPRIIVG
jgi:hypothetical protein